MSVAAARIALLLVGIVVWGVGARADDARLRLLGIGLLAASLLLRFVTRRAGSGDSGDRPVA